MNCCFKLFLRAASFSCLIAPVGQDRFLASLYREQDCRVRSGVCGAVSCSLLCATGQGSAGGRTDDSVQRTGRFDLL